jgi:hypothetical protein
MTEFLSALDMDTSARAHYAVDPLPLQMLNDVHVPQVVRCGGATQNAKVRASWVAMLADV